MIHHCLFFARNCQNYFRHFDLYEDILNFLSDPLRTTTSYLNGTFLILYDNIYEGFEILTAAIMKSCIFRDINPA
jgi:hypothetical protein